MTDHYSEDRRTFLKTVIVLGSAVASLSASKPAVATLPTAPDADAAPKKTYVETDHIRKYYQSARS